MLSKLLSRFSFGRRAERLFAEQWVARGLESVAESDFGAARAAFESALSCDDRHLAAMVNLAHVLREHAGDYSRAAAHYRTALARDPGLADVQVQLGVCLYEMGDAKAALECFKNVLERNPDHRDAGQHALFAMNALPDVTPVDLFLAHREWARRHADPLVRLPRKRAQGHDRPLRVAYLSGDFRDHATLAFLEPLLANHSRVKFEVSCYSSSPVRDAATARLQRLAQHWHDVHGVDDASVAQRIYEHGTDVLVDLSGHTRDNRLLVLARKPAAVQLSWLGYLKSTGLAAVDFRISDAAADPVGLSDAVHAERVVRLAGLMWAFEPPKDAPDLAVRAPDARITFGSFNHPAKINDAVLSVWAQLLLRVSASKLIIAGIAEDCGRERIAASLRKNGVETARLYFSPRLPKQRFLELVSTTDVALDPFPYNGGATTCDCLWMGVPVVTLAGSHGFARSGASLLTGAGLAEWVASSVADYVDIAARMAQDRQELAALRGAMRQRLLASELCDVAAFARRFEDAVIEIWRGECT